MPKVIDERVADAGAIASIGTVGDSYDNALTESVVGLYKVADELELATLSWVHWLTENRLRSSFGCLTPIEAENEYYRENTNWRWKNSPSTNPCDSLGQLRMHRGMAHPLRRHHCIGMRRQEYETLHITAALGSMIQPTTPARDTEAGSR